MNRPFSLTTVTSWPLKDAMIFGDHCSANSESFWARLTASGFIWGVSSMRDSRGGGFVDEPSGAEPIERERRRQRMRFTARDRVGEHVARTRRRLESSGAPAAIDEEARNRGQADDRRAVGRHID